MRVYYNANTRQLIVTEVDYAISVYLQKDETPTKKAADLIDIYADHPENVSTCRQIILESSGQLLPNEEAPQPELDRELPEPTNGDELTN